MKVSNGVIHNETSHRLRTYRLFFNKDRYNWRGPNLRCILKLVCPMQKLLMSANDMYWFSKSELVPCLCILLPFESFTTAAVTMVWFLLLPWARNHIQGWSLWPIRHVLHAAFTFCTRVPGSLLHKLWRQTGLGHWTSDLKSVQPLWNSHWPYTSCRLFLTFVVKTTKDLSQNPSPEVKRGRCSAIDGSLPTFTTSSSNLCHAVRLNTFVILFPPKRAVHTKHWWTSNIPHFQVEPEAWTPVDWARDAWSDGLACFPQNFPMVWPAFVGRLGPIAECTG